MSKLSVTAFSALILLSGCAALSPAGVIAAARLDPLDTAPQDITVAASVPDVMRLQDGDATLFLGFEPEDATVAPVAITAPLVVTKNQSGPRPTKQGEAIYVLAFAPADADAFAKAQSTIKQLRAAGVEGEGTLSVGITGGCLEDALDGPLTVSSWLRTSPQDGFVALTREVDLFEVLSEKNKAALKGALARC